ncbi:MAG: DUF1854 domain-containing protein [Clostridia bacterium]|nr:DUF1854 domain-containing protein [Clostridia bacterium]
MGYRFLDKTAKIELTDVYTVRLEFDGQVWEKAELRRMFPISDRDNYISVIDSDEHEIAMIRSYDDLTPDSAAAVKACFNDYYLIPKILKITECSDKTGMLKITAETDHGHTSFRIRNRHNDMKIYDPDRVIIRDSDDNRYEIESLATLDRKSWMLIMSFL